MGEKNDAFIAIVELIEKMVESEFYGDEKIPHEHYSAIIDLRWFLEDVMDMHDSQIRYSRLKEEWKKKNG